MKKLALAALAGALIAHPAMAHAQSADEHRHGAEQGQQDHSTPQAGDAGTAPETMPPQRMEMAQHAENCRCCCCQMMEQHGGGVPTEGRGDAPQAPAGQHEHGQ